MPSVGHPLWLLTPLLAVALLAIARRRAQLPGAWQRAIEDDLAAFLGATLQPIRTAWRPFGLVIAWSALGAALATISLGPIETPKLRNLDARIVVIDLGLPDLADDRIAAARYLIDRSQNVPTAVIAITEHAFDVVPLTRDRAHLDRYLQVLTANVMPIAGRSLLTGVERAASLLDRSGIQARQIAVFTGGTPPSIGRFRKPDRMTDNNIWLVLPDGERAVWQAFADELGASVIDDLETSHLEDDLKNRRSDAAARAVSIRERRDVTPWLIALLMPLWLLLFFRKQPE